LTDQTTASAGAAVLAWYNSFDHPNGAVVALARLKVKLSFDVSHHDVEQGLMEVAELFGADGSRPEKLYNRGPDDLWEWPGSSWVIEAKNERHGKLPKVDSGQLHDAMQWFAERAPERGAVPVIVARETEADYQANFPDGTRVLTPNGLALLVANLEKFMTALAQKEPIVWTGGQVDQLLISNQLAEAQFMNAYTRPLQK
jgi:hypothetical protein